jgi:hypothetical protein
MNLASAVVRSLVCIAGAFLGWRVELWLRPVILLISCDVLFAGHK